MPTYILHPTVFAGETTVVGIDDYEGGDLHDQNNRLIGTFTIVTQTFANVTDRPAPENLNTGMLDLQLFFTGQGHGQGQGQGGRLQETMRLQGAPEFVGPGPLVPLPPPGGVFPGRGVTRAHGSVSAATPLFASFITHQWSLTPISNSPTNTQFQLVIV